MLNKFVAELEEALSKGRIKQGLDLLRDWLATAEVGEPKALLEACSSTIKRLHVASLLRDLLSRYPSTLLGCPLMLHVEPDLELDSPSPGVIQLPYPTLERSKPCEDLQFIGWLMPDTELPVQLPFRQSQHAYKLPLREPTAVVALFRTHPDIYEYETLEMPPMWWGELFHRSGSTYLEGNMLMSYPDALDVAAAMAAGSAGKPAPKGVFRSDLGDFHELGCLFAEKARLHFMHD